MRFRRLTFEFQSGGRERRAAQPCGSDHGRIDGRLHDDRSGSRAEYFTATQYGTSGEKATLGKMFYSCRREG